MWPALQGAIACVYEGGCIMELYENGRWTHVNYQPLCQNSSQEAVSRMWPATQVTVHTHGKQKKTIYGLPRTQGTKTAINNLKYLLNTCSKLRAKHQDEEWELSVIQACDKDHEET